MNVKPKYDINCRVNHVCDDKTDGIVIDWRYFCKDDYFEYLVTFGVGICRLWLKENELNHKKTN